MLLGNWGFVLGVGTRVIIFYDGLGLQVGQASQLGLAEAMVAQAFHDAADFRRGSQDGMGSAQCGGAAGDDLTFVAHLQTAVGVFKDLHLHAGVAGTLLARQQLQGASLVLDRVVPGHLAGVL